MNITKEQADKVIAALEVAYKQNGCDMVLTGEELRNKIIPALTIMRGLAEDAEPVASDSLGQPDNLEVIIDAFIEDYEMVGETEDGRDACHTPTDGERALIKDAICGLLADTDWDNAWGDHVKSLAHPPEADKLLQQAQEALERATGYLWAGTANGKHPDALADVRLHKKTITAIRTYQENKNA